MEPVTTQRATWTAPEHADGTPDLDVAGFAVTMSAGQEYHRAAAALRREGVEELEAAVVDSAMARARSLPGGDVIHDHGDHDHSGMAGMAGGEAEGTVHVADMHVDNLHVESMHEHGHSHGGGSWAGHVIPATMFTVWGLWWAYNAFAAAAVVRTTGRPFRSRPWYPLEVPALRGRGLLTEPWCKAVLPSLGIFCELYFHPKWGASRGGVHWNSLYNADGSFHESNGKYWQHASMYMFFVLSGAVDLVFARTLPSGASHALLGLAFFNEAFLFWEHLQSQSGLMAEIHTLLVLAIAANAAAVVAELLARGSLLAAYSRAYFTLLQASWFWQISTALYGTKPWAPGLATDMAVVVIFCQHVFGLALGLIAANHAFMSFYAPPLAPALGGAVSLEQGTKGATPPPSLSPATATK